MTRDVDDALRRAHDVVVTAASTARRAASSFTGTMATRHADQLTASEQKLAEFHCDALAQSRAALEISNGDRRRADTEFEHRIAGVLAADPWSTAPFDDQVWDGFRPADAVGPRATRIGVLKLGTDGREPPPVPALVALLGSDRHLLVSGAHDDLTTARTMVAAVLLRLVAASAPGSLRVAMADPAGHGREFSGFLRLPPALRVGDRVAVSERDVERLLGAVAEHVVDVTQTRLTNVHHSIADYNAVTTGLAVPYLVLALSGFPDGFNPRSVEVVLDLARNGPRAGVHIVASVDRSVEMPRGVSMADLSVDATSLRIKKDELSWDDPDFGRFAVVPDPPPAPERANRWLDMIGAAAAGISDALPFDRIAVPLSDRWNGDSSSGLTVQIGVGTRGEPHWFTVGSGRIQHGLVGGDTQMGKSNLLQVLITQLGLRYPPEQLQMYLLDFKQVEFEAYAGGQLPHARVVASRTDREFCLSVLRDFRAEIDRRAALFQEAGVLHLRDFRDSGRVLPRSLLVMDEFQVLFPDHDRLSVAAGALLEDIARRGAAFGLHLLIASQSPASGQASTYLRPVYEQMRLRIALGCGQPGVSYAILGDGNDAATRLTRPGDAVFSDRGGAAGPSPIIRIAELPNRERLAWLATIGDLGKGASYPPPAVFDPAAPARIEPRCTTLMAQQGWSAPGATVDAWLGEPIAMASGTSATFERDPYSNLLIVADQDLGYRLLTAAVLSIATRLAPADASFAVADFARSSSPFRGHFGRVAEQVPHTVDVAGPRGAAQMVDGLIELLDTRAAAPLSPHPSRFLIVAGLHRWDELAGEYRQRSDVADRLARLADEGPELGIHLVVWSEGYAAVERAWQRDGLRLFYLRVAGPGTSESDSTAVLGTPAASTLTENRALFTTKDWPPGQTEKFKPYALPSIEAFAPLGKRSPASLDVR